VERREQLFIVALGDNVRGGVMSLVGGGKIVAKCCFMKSLKFCLPMQCRLSSPCLETVHFLFLSELRQISMNFNKFW